MPAERRTAKLSTSSISATMTNGRRAAISGIVSVSSLVTLRWLSPSMSLGNACGLISTSAVAPWRASASAATCASPRAIVVFPVPGGPASTMSPCGSPESIDSLRPCCSTSSACASSRSFTSRGTMMASQSRSWCSAGSDVQREHAWRQRRTRHVHHSPGRLSSGHWICDSSCIDTSVSSASSKSTIGSISVRIVSSSESNMWTRTSRHWLTRIVVEVLMPEVVIDDDQIAFLPAVVLPVVGRDAQEAVAVAFDDIQPRLARVAMDRLRLAGRKLDHHLREAGRLVADRAVVEELRARAARRGEDLLLVVRRVDTARAALLCLLRRGAADDARADRRPACRSRPSGAAAAWRMAPVRHPR